MTEEQKQALIEFCSTVASDIKSDAVAHEDEIIMRTLQVFEIALAALTAQPVKLPAPIGQTETSNYGLEPRDGYGLHWGSVETLNECKKLLRQQGYEVQE